MSNEAATAQGGTGSADGQRTERIRIEQHSFAGSIWFAGWLFSIGFLHLPLLKALLAVVLWPYYLGVRLTPILP